MDFNAAIEQAANQAIFQHQYNTNEAVRFVRREVRGCTEEQALLAVRSAMVFHR